MALVVAALRQLPRSSYKVEAINLYLMCNFDIKSWLVATPIST